MANTNTDSEVCTDEPTLDEVCRAVKKLKNGRAAGCDNIPPELLKCASSDIGQALGLHALFQRIWRSGRVPPEWKDGIIVSLYRVAQKTPRTLRNYNGAYTLWGEISFGTFVDQYVLLLTYKF